MCIALQELSELSLDLQECNMDRNKANQKSKAPVQVYEERRQTAGQCYGQCYRNAKAVVGNLRVLKFYCTGRTVKMTRLLIRISFMRN